MTFPKRINQPGWFDNNHPTDDLQEAADIDAATRTHTSPAAHERQRHRDNAQAFADQINNYL